MVTFNPAATAADTASAASAASAATNNKSAMGKDAFLQLLVAQIRNQNPLDPADGVEFLSQLAQFSQLEQTMSIREDIGAVRAQAEAIAEVLKEKPSETATGTTKTGEASNV